MRSDCTKRYLTRVQKVFVLREWNAEYIEGRKPANVFALQNS